MSIVNPAIFKAYDIRGFAPGEIDPAAARRIGSAFVHFTGARVVAVGRDMRATSPSLTEAVIAGIRSQGADVVDLGLVSTPVFYFGAAAYPEHDAGIMVTASHNPAKYNGFKLVRRGAVPIGAGSGMEEFRDLVLSAKEFPPRTEGELRVLDPREDYLQKIFYLVSPKALASFRIAIDAGNGMAGVIVPEILSRIPGEFFSLYLELDGTFPNHEANPLKTETLADLRREVAARGADVGVAYDGDADRVGFVDETGEPVPGDLMAALLAPRLLRDAPGAAVLYDVRSSWVVKEEIIRAGGKPVMTPVGHGLVKRVMKETGAIFGSELSMHYYYRDFFTVESGDLTVLHLLALMTERGERLSELVRPLRRYVQTGEINFEIEDKEGVMRRIEERYASTAREIVRIDGLRMEFDDWWFSVRLSNTEPLLRLNIEAKERRVMDVKKEELAALIESV
ncbi:MAG: phosphomannomutase/phosphoglucomutase [Patescibacteria group bacterium]